MKELLMKRAGGETGAKEITPEIIAEFHRAAEPDVRLAPLRDGRTQYRTRKSPVRPRIPEMECYVRAFGQAAEPLDFLDVSQNCRMKEVDGLAVGLLLQFLKP